ncbi:MAG: 50S ribosomal protein L35 [bacterium]|nr:50S ribosomal protein L35 [bacterium]
MANQKLKTNKTISKRVKISRGKNKTITVRKAGQDHFNAKQSGKTKRNKRGGTSVAKVNVRNIRRSI